MNRLVLIPAALLSMATAKAQEHYFTRITEGPLVNTAADSRSVNWIDVNNDGFVDCFISNGPQGGQNNMLFLNEGNGSFTMEMNDTITKDRSPSDGATFADMDNDGDIDAFVVNWYNVNNLLYRNQGSGSFTRITEGNPANDAGYSETAAWGDYDRDGLVDLYVCNSAGSRKNFLYRNTGNGNFEKISQGAPVTDAFYSRCINWVDIDNDGDPDMFVTNEENQQENIYRNDENGTFTALTTGDLLNNGGHTMSGSWADYDNDGDLDVFLANDRGHNALFRNEGNFAFTQVAADTFSAVTARSFSAAWSDIDNDGDQDIFITNAFGNAGILSNFLYTNNGDGTFSMNRSDACTQDSAWSYGCAFADYDNDGFQDLAVATCRFGGSDYPDLLYHNNGNSNNWISIGLQGTTSNRSAIGARVYVKATIRGAQVWQMRELSAQSSYCGQNDLRTHFGLGDATMADSIRIVWPSGLTEHYTQAPAGDFLSYAEGPLSSIMEKALADDIQVYPNPAGNRINVSGNGAFSRIETLSLKTRDGRHILSRQINGQSPAVLELARYHLAAGIYLLEIKQGRHRAIRQIVLR